MTLANGFNLGDRVEYQGADGLTYFGIVCECPPHFLHIDSPNSDVWANWSRKSYDSPARVTRAPRERVKKSRVDYKADQESEADDLL